MGNQREYNPEGGFSQYLYESVSEVVEMNGIRAKVVKFIGNEGMEPANLPNYANTSDMYFKVNNDGEIGQARLYIGRRSVIDFDWDHSHTNKSKNKQKNEVFPEGVVHVQVYKTKPDGTPYRDSKHARYMTEEEIAKYGPLIHHFNPNVKFRK